MNRSILIVMCDFVVISMLSMITGLSTLQNPYGDDGAVVNSRTANVIIEQLRSERMLLEEAYEELKAAQEKFGYSPAREEAMKKIESRIAQAGLQLALLEKKDLPGLSGAEKKPLKSGKADLNTRYMELMNEINSEQVAGLKSGGSDLSLDYGGDGSGGGSEKLSSNTKVVAQFDSEELKNVRDLLSRKEVDLEHTQAELADSEVKLKELTLEKSKLNTKIAEYKSSVENMEGEIAQAEEKLLTSQRQLVITRRKIQIKEVELAENRKQLNSLQGVLKRAVGELSKSKAEVINSQKQTEVVKNELADAQKDLLKLRDSFKTDVLSTYGKTVKKVKVSTVQKRFWGDYVNGGEFYLPVIKLDNRPMVISLFRFLSGNSLKDAQCEKIAELDYYYGAPDDEKLPLFKLEAPLAVSRRDIRVALMELPEMPEETLDFLTVSMLKKRGLQDLFLFKIGSYGDKGGDLTGRCSMSLKKSDEYLYIRNGRNSAESAANYGDIVMTREGGFVGVVVEVRTLSEGGEEAKCFVFPDDFLLRNSIMLSTSRNRSSGYFEDFSAVGGDLLERIKRIENGR